MPLFDWDKHNIDHIAAHGITPEQVEQAFENGVLKLGPRYIRGEERQNYLGMTDEGFVLTVVVTERNNMVRVVTAHRQSRLRELYERLREARDAENSEYPRFQE